MLIQAHLLPELHRGRMASGLCSPAGMSSALSSLQVIAGGADFRCPSASPSGCGSHRGSLVTTAATKSTGTTKITGPGGGTRYVGGRRVKVLQVGGDAKIRDKVSGDPAAVKLLSRVEQLRLLTKAEKAGLLSLAESLGLSLTTIEDLGLLSKAENLGLLSAATDPGTPGALLTAALLLLVGGPLFVYLVPEDSTPLVVLQFVVAALTVVGGATAFAASSFVSTLQRSD